VIEPGSKVLLYLGRLHAKKGLPNLLRAWKIARERSSFQTAGWALAIAGWDQNGHQQELMRLRHELAVSGVHFLGPQFGTAKAAAYYHANAFILPSLSEGLPMVVLEAWANNLPVVMTPQCNLPEGFEAQAAIHTQPAADSLTQGLNRLFSMTDNERTQMGARGHKLVVERFGWPKIGAQMHEVCKWILGQAPRPACVRTEDFNN
jgi:poly(glycerol-phosphate) alpha-glucosyltransferase